MSYVRDENPCAMAARRWPASVACALLFAVAAGCGDNAHDAPMPDAPSGDAPPDSGLDEDGCRILTVGWRDFEFNLFDQLLGLRFPVAQNLEGERAEVLHLDLYDSSTPDLPPLTTGTFDLSANVDLATCQHCVWVEVDESEDGIIDTIYLATQGALTIDSISDPFGPVFAGSTGRVVMRRAQVDENGRSTLVNNGDCVSIPALAFDTTPAVGKACESAEDCNNALLEVCDPSTNACSPPECSYDAPCPDEGELCLIQYRDQFDGACYQTCNPSAQVSGCAGTQTCTQRGPDRTFGICKHQGAGALGDTCEIEDNSTACAGGAVCSSESRTCAATCAFFAQDTGCPADTACGLLGLCEPPSAGSAVALGQACAADALQAQGCASDGEAYRGICFGFEGDPLTCQKACLGEEGCASGEFCAPRYTSGVGICLPLPVCGDGQRGEINETCDDGNTMDGDGCSADCQTVDAGVLCMRAPQLAFGTSIQGDTTMGVDGLMSTCQAGLARANLFDLVTPGPGRLRLHLTSPSSQTLSTRSTCDDGTTELACRGDFGVATDQELIMQITDPTPTTLTAMVSAATVLEEGPYVLAAEFVPELCGDGIVAGREVCDDNNTTDGDGCTADCRTIEYDFYCTNAPELSTTTANAADLTGAPTLFGASCAVDDGREARPSRMYRFVAPTAGTLHLDLDDDTSFAVLDVREGCGEPSATPELACRPAFLNGEIDVPLASGQSITAVVVPYFVDSGLGTFTLNATFTPQ